MHAEKGRIMGITLSASISQGGREGGEKEKELALVFEKNNIALL